MQIGFSQHTWPGKPDPSARLWRCLSEEAGVFSRYEFIVPGN